MKCVWVICVYIVTPFNDLHLSLLLISFGSFDYIFDMLIAYQLI